MVSNDVLVKLAYKKLAPSWGNRVPDLSKQTWEDQKVLLASDNYTFLRNQIYEELINKIAMTSVIEMSYSNPLGVFKSGSMEFGDTYEEIATDVIEGRKFQGSDKAEDQFAIFDSDVHAAYYRINREDYYPITIKDIRIRRAFIDSNGLNSLLNSIINKLDGSNTVDEFIYAKKLISAYYNNTDKPLLASQKIKVPNILDSRTKFNIANFIETAKLTAKSMMFNSRLYTPSQIMMASNPANMVFICNYKISVINEVQNLSCLFNPQYSAINMPIIDIDGFDDEKVIAMICDKSLFDIKLVMKQITQADNARALYRNHFFHIHQIYKASPFHPAVFFVV